MILQHSPSIIWTERSPRLDAVWPAWCENVSFLIQVKGPFNTAENSTNQNLRWMIKTLATDTEDSPVWPLPLVTRSKNRAAISVPNKQKWLSCSPRLLPPPCYSPLPVNGYLKGMSEIREKSVLRGQARRALSWSSLLRKHRMKHALNTFPSTPSPVWIHCTPLPPATSNILWN